MAESVINLTVHGIGATSRSLDQDEDLTWVSVERFERVMDAVVDRSDVRITFDDGNASDVEIALPRLVERGLRAEFFVLAGELGKPGRIDADGVRALLTAGMRVGSHGWAHRDWRTIGPFEERQELAEAHAVLGRLTGSPVSRVAIPFGSYDRRVLGRLRQAGVTRAYTSDGGPARTGAWLQARTSLKHDLDRAWIDGVLGARTGLRGLGARLYKRMR
ncbi:polysaccharide deacetylase family protein [Nonomuraea sp. NBC_01738]|uniref:polysaccharide deacetylase family protein n=1 Tax=Nonomuraea sp. NBC_01738 TaxID=2976003 RepID=UPI002E0D87CB|nr:polysaccharide deacetylase family protein [Nonomuraea sp. NBC_01738]